jgi:tRNA(fMet)-specific endonuclease VapC
MKRLTRLKSEIAIAATVWHELLFGLRMLPASKRRENIEAYLTRIVYTSVPILPYDEAAASWHATERARLVQLGLTPAFSDSQIAAVAKIHDLTLITRNVKDFSQFEGLHVESWHTRTN